MDEPIRILQLDLVDFRGFEHLKLPLEPDLTVLVGANGSGKTSVLDAIVYSTTWQSQGQEFSWPIRLGSAHAETRMTLGDGVSSWVAGVEHDATTDRVRSRPVPKRSPNAGPPVICYGVLRKAVDQTPGSTAGETWTRSRALIGWANASADYGQFFHWFKEMEDLENERIAHGEAEEDPGLAVVRRAVHTLFPEFDRIRVRRQFPPFAFTPILTLEKRGEVLPFSVLSEGERTTLAMVADLARRLVLYSQTPEEALETPAIVLIDELEQHAHPAWQRQLVRRLPRVFPNVQWITTTHSPVVVQECLPRQLRVLRDFQLVESHHGRGLDANAVLEDVFEQPSHRLEVHQKIRAIEDALDGLDHERAQALTAELAADTDDGPDAVYYRNLLKRLTG